VRESEVAGSETWKTDFGNRTVDLGEIASGGPPKDGIPAVDDPKFVDPEEADRWLDDREPVAIVHVEDEIRAYPLQILIWHEIVNDEIAGTPVSVTFCPLCNTTLAFDRRFDELVLDFGTTGRLRHSDLIMYDRQTETWWQQATGEGIIGRFAGRELAPVPAPVMSWGDAKEQLKGVHVLSRETGHSRTYGQNPYHGYDSGRPIPDFFQSDIDGRLPAMERVVALRDGNCGLAIPFSELEARRVVNLLFAGRSLAVFWVPGTSSALDEPNISSGRDVGASAVFESEHGGRTLSFDPAEVDGLFRDANTGTLWNISGEAVFGDLAGQQLVPVAHGNHFWFAWAAFLPAVEIWKAS